MSAASRHSSAPSRVRAHSAVPTPRRASRLFAEGGLLSPKSPLGRAVAGATAALLVAAGLVVGAVVAPASAAGVLELSATVDENVLAGESANVKLTAKNTASNGNDLYNASFWYQLAPGVSYVAGSTSGGVGLPEPRTITVQAGPTPDPAVDYVVLVWDNVSDLVAQASSNLEFKIKPDVTRYPVGSQFAGVAQAYASSDERVIPKFGPKGLPDAATSLMPNDEVAGLDTVVSAIKVTKAESPASSESELLRGVHDNTTEFEITVRNTDQGSTTVVTVVDYLPAGMEFLGCGAVDNTTGQAEEYAGSGTLAGTPVPANCLVPTAVETVLNPTTSPAIPAGVYTKVTWTIANLAPGSTTTIKYAAGIPLFENTMWPAGSAPAAAGGTQASNLDNNTGASTRQNGAPASLTNRVFADGTYGGIVSRPEASATSDSDSATVEVVDLAIAKSAVSNKFTSGGVAEFNLRVRTSEYTSAADMVITDVIPDGLCPTALLGSAITLAPGAPALPAECAQTPADVTPVTGATVTSITYNADGSFTMVMVPNPVALSAEAVHDISYKAAMGSSYDGSGSTPGDPTVAGDSFVNTVKITGNTTDVSGRQPGVVAVEEDSEATLTTDGPVISKRVAERPATDTLTADSCAGLTFGDALPPATVPAYQFGDYVCFELNVNFATQTQTKNASVFDFVPTGTSYIASYVDTAASTTKVTPIQQTAGLNAVRPGWGFGEAVGGGNRVGDDWFVSAGAKAKIYVLVEVVQSINPRQVDITGNLMKFRQESTNGTVLSLRDEVNFAIAADPSVTLDKRITHVNGTAATNPSAATVKQGDVVSYSVDLRNTGTAALRNDVPVTKLQVWDALPKGYDCGQWAFSSTGSTTGVCVNPGQSGYPAAGELSADATGRSLVKWTVNGPLAAGATVSVTYTLTVPADAAVSSVFENHASLVGFEAPTTGPVDAKYLPENSLRVPQAGETANAPEADDKATLNVPAAVLKKQVVSTAIAGVNNNGGATQFNGSGVAVSPWPQHVAGEYVTYKYTLEVPAFTLIPAGSVMKDDGRLGTNAALANSKPYTLVPGGSVVVPPGLGAYNYDVTTGVFTFVDAYDNNTSLAQPIEVTIVVWTDGKAPDRAHGSALYNRASFTMPGKTAQTATAQTQFVIPSPQVDKSVTTTAGAALTDGIVGADEELTYTIQAWNATGRPTAYASVVTDCVPAGLLVTSVETGWTKTDNGCADGGTLLTWNAGDLQAEPAARKQLSYNVRVDPQAGASGTYVNKVSLTANTLPSANSNFTNGNTVLTAKDELEVVVAGATIDKSVTPTKATIGDTVSYTVTVAIPPHTNYYNAKIVDAFPSGIAVTGASVSAPGVGTFSCAAPANNTLECAAPVHIPSSPTARVATLTYTGTVVSFGSPAKPVAGNSLDNTATFHWGTSPGSPVDKTTSEPGTASVTVLEPSLSIAKAVSKSRPQPGERFTYTVTITNATGATVSTAYNADVVDTLPAGIDPNSVVFPATDAGTRTGNKISWSIASLAPGASVTRTYTAVLAASSTLTPGATHTNTVDVTNYTSLADPAAGRSYDNVTPATAVVTPAFPAIDLTKTTTGSSIAHREQPFGWTLTARNSGAGSAQTVTLVDTLPANWTYDASSARVSVGGGAATAIEPAVSGRTLTWTIGSAAPAAAALAPNASIVVQFTATPGASAQVGANFNHRNLLDATFTDTSDASGNSTDQYESTQATAVAQIHSADLQLTKTPSASLRAGETGTGWTITVRNNGPDTAVGPFTITDTPGTLPTGVTVTGATGTGWTCTVPVVSTGDFSCVRAQPLDTLASGASFETISVSVAVAADVASGTIVGNTASVTGTTHDPNTGNNTDDGEVPIKAEADLAVVKTNVAPAPNAGGPISWSIAATNNGPAVSLAPTGKPITITDTIPAGVGTVTAVLPTGWTASPAQPWAAGTAVTFSYVGDPMLVGATARLTLSGTVDAGLAGNTIISNTAVIAKGGTDEPTGSAGNNTSTVPVTPTINTTLGISKTRVVKDGSDWIPATSAIVPGENVQYLIEVANTGTANARSVSVSDVLNPYLSYVGFESVVGTWTTADEVNFALTGALPAASGSNTASFVLTAKVAAAHNAAVENTATASGSNSTNTPSDDDNGTPTRKGDLSIAKSHTAAPVAGSVLPFTIEVTANGPSVSSGAFTITDTLPAGISYVANSAKVSVDGATAVLTEPSKSSQVLTWTIGTASSELAVGSTIVVTLDTLIDAGVEASTLQNVATISAPNDTNPANNTARDSVVVTTTATAAVTKDVVGTGPFVAGTDVSYTMSVTVTGPSTAYNVTLEDAVPVGLTVKSIGSTGDGWTWVGALGSRASLAPGTYSIPVVATVNANVIDGATLTNTARLAWTDTSGPKTDDDPETITVTANADLGLTKTAVDDKGDPVQFVLAGTQGRYVMQAKNYGPSHAVAPLTIVDRLPAGLSYAGLVDPLSWSCTPGAIDPVAGQRVSCVSTASAALAAGADAAPLTMLVQFDVNMPAGDFTNTAVVSSPTDEGADTHSNTDDATVTTEQAPLISLVKDAVTSAPGAEKVGDTVNYTFTAKNTGNVTLTGVVISDKLADLSALKYTWPDTANPGVLLQGESVTATAELTLTQAHLDAASVLNTALVSGTSPRNVVVNSSDDATVALPQAPQIELAKTGALAAGVVGIAGDRVNYTFTVKNVGNVTLSSVGIADALPGLSAVTFGAWPDAATPGVLAPGESVEAHARYALTQADVDAGVVNNTATTTGTPAVGNPVTDDASAAVTTAGTSAISLVKNGGFETTAGGLLGEKVLYTFVVTNTGSLTLHDVTITDALPGLSAVEYVWPGAAGVLAPGQSATASASLVLEQQHMDAGNVENTATATGTDPKNGTVSAVDDVTVSITPLPSISLAKTGVIQTNGSTVLFTMLATNSGNITLHDVKLADAMPGLSVLAYSAWPGAEGVLAPGQSVTVTATYELTGADRTTGSVSNTATVNGKARPGTNTPSTADTEVNDDSTAKVTIPPRGGIAKTGVDAAPIGFGAALLLGLGMGLVFFTRRRKKMHA